MIQLFVALAIAGANPTTAPAPGNPFEEQLIHAAAFVRLEYPDEALGSLAGLRAVAPSQHYTPLLDLLQGRALLQRRDLKNAQEILTPLVASSRTVVSSFALLYLARTVAQSGSCKKALKLFEKLWDARADGLAPDDFLLDGLNTALECGSDKDWQTWLDRVRAASGLEHSARLTAKVSALARLNRNLQPDCTRLLLDYPCAPLPQTCANVVSVSALKPSKRFDRARKLFECWGYEESASEFRHFLSDARFKRFVVDSHYFLAEIHARKLRDDRAQAFAHYEYVYKHSSSRKAYSLYQMGRCMMNLEKYDKALELFRKYVRDYPAGQFVQRCHYYEGWLPYDHDKLDEALPGFQQFLSRYGKSELRSYVLWFKAWSEYRLGRMKDALVGLQQLVGYGNNIVAGKALYWRGKAWAQLDKKVKAQAEFARLVERYPLCYYGVLGWRLLASLRDQPPHPVFTTVLPPPLRPTPADLLSLVPERHRSRYRDLVDALLIGEVACARKLFRQDGEHFFRYAGSKNRNLAHFVAWSLLEEPQRLREWGRSHARQSGRIPGPGNQLAWMMEYPEAYRALIEVEGARNDLPPWFLYSIMRQESRYRRGVVSWADAMGLMQVVPSTGRMTAELLGLRFERDLLFSPESNIKLAAGYLGALNRDMKGQLTLVAASYNAGPLAVREFLKTNHNRGFDFVVEEIAYNEARNYCRKVAGHVVNYLVLYSPREVREDIVRRLFPEKVDFAVGESVQY